MIDYDFIISLLNSMLRMSIPLIFAATGEIIAEKSGVINIGLEGQMLLGAFVSLCVSYETGSVLIGVLAAGLLAALSTLPVYYIGVVRRQNQSVVGIMLNIFIIGFTSFFYRVFYGVSLTPPSLKTLPSLNIPILNRIPVLGETIFNQTWLAYTGIIVTVIIWFILKHTVLGIKLKAVGENPRAAQAAGISVLKTRLLSLMSTGFLAGLGGAFLTVAYAGRFSDGITSGRGYIALAIVIFGRWNPVVAMGGALLFGLVDAFQLRAQTIGFDLPYQFFVMMPYLVVLLSIFFTGKNATSPAALGQPFEKEGR